MIQLKQFLTQTRTLWVTFCATILMTLAFLLIMLIWDFDIIDEIWSTEQLKLHLADLTEKQKTVHTWTTGTLDVLYPFAYGAFFIGMALRYFGKYGPLLALPSILVVPVDLTEGVVQIMLLTGNQDFIGWKEIVTPLKLALYLPGLMVALIGIVIVCYRFSFRDKI